MAELGFVPIYREIFWVDWICRIMNMGKIMSHLFLLNSCYFEVDCICHLNLGAHCRIHRVTFVLNKNWNDFCIINWADAVFYLIGRCQSLVCTMVLLYIVLFVAEVLMTLSPTLQTTNKPLELVVCRITTSWKALLQIKRNPVL